MAQVSAGILLHRTLNGVLEVFLVHPGGPFWARKDAGAWSIPKGIVDAQEDRMAAARREFEEEVGGVPEGPLLSLGDFRQPGGKTVMAFALSGDFDPARLVSNRFEMEWPPHSGKRVSFPEVDRAGWFDLLSARDKLLPGQRPILDALQAALG